MQTIVDRMVSGYSQVLGAKLILRTVPHFSNLAINLHPKRVRAKSGHGFVAPSSKAEQVSPGNRFLDDE